MAPNNTNDPLPSVMDVGFETFTAKLVVDVFDALVSANIRQTQNYVDLVAAMSKTLKEYVNETHDGTALPEILDFLAKLAPAGPDSDNPSRLAPGAPVTPADQNALSALKLDEEDGGMAGTGVAHNVPNLESDTLVTTEGQEKTLTEAGWNAILEAVARRIAASKYSLLQEMVKQGALRLVVDDGVIETRLRFKTHTNNYWNRSRSMYGKKTRDWGVRARSGFGLARWISISGGISDHSVTVNTERVREGTSSGTSVDIHGLVRINFRTDYLPLAK